MKRKIFLLTVSCIFTVVALACVQSYFIYNTYQLRSKEADIAISAQFLDIEMKDQLDTLNAVWMNKTRLFLDDYWNKEADKNGYVTMINGLQDSLSGAAVSYFSGEGFFDGYNLSYSNYITSITVFDVATGASDTIYRGKLKVYSTNTENLPEMQASKSVWNDGGAEGEAFRYEIASTRYYSIADWQEKIIIKMSGLLIFSVLLLLLVVLLFYLSIKNLIAQRKIADVKTDFINNITHEFQTPLAALDIAVKTLQKKDVQLSQEHFSNTLNIIGRQNLRMQKLFSRVTEASLDPDVSISSIENLGCNDIMDIVHDFKLTHDATIECDTPNGILLKMDRFHLNTILINLLDNAVKYGASAVALSIRQQDGKTILKVKDNGPGIAEKEHPMLFEKFYRVEKGNIHTTKGLGLGLYYVRSVVKAYNGDIAVKSAPGQGTEFIIEIPLV